VVYVVTADEKTKQTTVRLVPVQLGIAADSWIEVKGDLIAGQQVVVEGNERLRPGAEIVAIPAAVKPPSAEKPPSGKRAERPKLSF